MECNKTKFVQKYIVNEFTTQFTIPGRKFSYAF